jgi:hypothetical protein
MKCEADIYNENYTDKKPVKFINLNTSNFNIKVEDINPDRDVQQLFNKQATKPKKKKG